MADITLSDLLTLIFSDLANTIERTSDEAALKLQVTDLDLDIPAYLRLQEAGLDPQQEPTRFILTLPSTRESPPTGSVGRISLTIGVRTLPKPAEPKEEP